MRRAALALVSILAIAGAARADDDVSMKEATRLFEEANRLRNEGQFARALLLYEAAYTRFASPKILVNIGTMLKQLGRDVEAANAYERYLADPGANPALRDEVRRALTDIDSRVALLEIEVNEAGSRITVDGQPTGVAKLRVSPGKHEVVAEKAGFQRAAIEVTARAGERARARLALVAEPAPAPAPPAPEPSPPPPSAEPAIPREVGPIETVISDGTRRPGRFAGWVRADVDGRLRGLSLLVAGSYRVNRLLSFGGGPILGPSMGVYAGGSLLFGNGAFSPTVALGIPVFLADGPRVGIHGGAGLDWALHPRLSLTLEAAVEVFPGVSEAYETVQLVGALGAVGRL